MRASFWLKSFTVVVIANSPCLAGATNLTNPFEAHDAQSWSPIEHLVGTWRVQVTTFNCNNGVENPPFSSLLTFGAKGTLTGTTGNPIFLAGQRSSDYGIWRRVGESSFTASTEAFIEFSSTASPGHPPLARGKQLLEQVIEMTGPDSFTSDATLTFFDESNTEILTGCAKASATRFL